MRCDLCPVRADLACLGETTPALCRNVAEGQPGRSEQLAYYAEHGRFPPPPELPAFSRRVGSLTRSVVAHAADGFRVAPDEAQVERWATCRACPKFDAESTTCAICGCYLRVKIRMASEACPDDPPRWSPA